jgi:undecaprenyl-diphosphatase
MAFRHERNRHRADAASVAVANRADYVAYGMTSQAILDYGSAQSARSLRVIAIIAVVWIVLFLLALWVDIPLATWVHQNKFNDRGIRKAHRILFYLGNFWAAGAIGILLGFFHPWKWRAAVVLWISGAVGGIFYCLIKWAVGRTRPFKGNEAFEFQHFTNGIRGIWDPMDNAAFPSGHATLAFAMAACLHRCYPRQAWLFYMVATLIAIQRVSRGAHYPSDVVAGAGLGLVSAWIVLEVATRKGHLPNRRVIPEQFATNPDAAR